MRTNQNCRATQAKPRFPPFSRAGPFLESPGNLSGPENCFCLPCLHQFKIKVTIKESSLFIPLGEGGGGARQNHEGDRNVWSASLGGGVWGDSYCVNIVSGGRCQNCNNNNNSYNTNVFYNTWAFEGWNQRWRATLLRHIVIWVCICAEGTLTWLSQTFELYRFHQFSLKVEACCL